MSEAEKRQQVLELLQQMFVSPSDFCYRWGLGYEELAKICCVSKSTTYHWLAGLASRRVAGRSYQRILAVTDFLLSNAERVHPLLERWQQRE